MGSAVVKSQPNPCMELVPVSTSVPSNNVSSFNSRQDICVVPPKDPEGK